MESDMPVKYYPGFIPDSVKYLTILQKELEWIRHSDAPRCEYYVQALALPYTYGRGRGRRTYEAQIWHPAIMDLCRKVEVFCGCEFETCFLNRYLDQSDHLGWHADNSPEMDDTKPIAIISLGVARRIMFRHNSLSPEAPSIKTAIPRLTQTEVLLAPGSLCIMPPGMQDEWQHRIPKSSNKCGERISLTFRGYLPPSSF